MIITVTGENGDSTTVGDEALTYTRNLRVTRNEIEKAVGFDLEDGDVVEVIVDKQKYRCTISVNEDEDGDMTFGILTGVNGKEVEHSLSIEG